MTIEDIENELDNPIYPRSLGEWYDKHKVFNRLDEILDFYRSLSYSSSKSTDILATGKVMNIQSSIYQSIAGTMESIKLLLQNGRCNDAFTLIRKYSDAIVIDTYTSILIKETYKKYFNDKADWESIINNKIRRWSASKTPLMEEYPKKELQHILTTFSAISKILKLSPKTKESLYSKIRDICNDNVHYNSFKNFLWNDVDYIDYNRDIAIILLNNVYTCITFLVSLHFSFIYESHPEYFASSDYGDYLEFGEQPIEGCERWIAPIFQIFFNNVVYSYNQKIGEYLISLNLMDLYHGTE